MYGVLARRIAVASSATFLFASALLSANSARAVVIPAATFTMNDGFSFAAPALSGVDNLDGTFSYSSGLYSLPGAWECKLDFTMDPDPEIAPLAFSITNLAPTTKTYTVVVTSPVTLVLASSLTGGSVQGGVTDNNGNGATLGQSGATPMYMSQIDGKNWVGLMPPTTSGSLPITVGAFLSDSRSANFGTPIPNLPGPGVTTDIGITLKFTLTPGDSASFTGVFVVAPVPEPNTMAMASCGLAVVIGGLLRRRHLWRSRR